MRTHGTLTKWNDDRGFGFVTLPQSHEEVFVHISAFPRDGVRPRIGETISFEIRTAADGRKRAEGVMRPGSKGVSARRRDAEGVRGRSRVGSMLTGTAVLVIALAGYNSYVSRQETRTAASPSTANETRSQSFRCDGRTHCSQMTSCAEARYFIEHCPDTQVDGNGDGEPCEQQWCN